MASKRRLFLLQLMVACCLLPLSIQSLFRDVTLTRSQCDEDYKLKKAKCEKRGLDSVPQTLSEDTETLYLFDNNIRSLRNSSFQRYPLITRLDLANNDIRMIEPNTFYPLKDLFDLDLRENPHLVLPDTGLFRWASKLTNLDLSSSNLKRLPNDTLEGISHLDRLSFLRNQLSFINISSCGSARRVVLNRNRFEHLNSDNFNFVCHTDLMWLTSNPIKSVDPDLIASLHVRSLVFGRVPLGFGVLRNIFIGVSRSEIEEIKIVDGHLTVFSKGIVDPLHDHYLAVLDFSYNKISGLYPFFFSNLTKVSQLYLSLNNLVQIEPDFFDGMRELKILEADHNRLEFINRNNHTWTIDLVKLDLSHNCLKTILQFTFFGLKNLTLLDLSSNRYLYIFELTSLSGLDNIQNIDLSDCGIIRWQLDAPKLKSLSLNSIETFRYALKPESFNRSRFLVNLQMRNVGIHSRNLWDKNISLFDGLFYLQTLDMTETHLALSEELFRQLSALQELNLDDCHIRNLHSLIFAKLESLKKLTLKGNMITQLPCDLLTRLGKLTSIDLGRNYLTFLDETVFSKNVMLTNISLANNKFTHFNRSTFEHDLPSLSFIDLSANPISCNCDLKWLIAWLHGKIHILNKDSTICSLASMAPLREKPLLDFDVNVFCRPNILPICLTPFAVICLLVIVILVYRNRWTLKYKLFLLKLAAIGYKEIRDARDHDDYEFDLNIISYDDDEEWVREYLRPAIEEHLPQFQRNVFGDKDLVLGMHYLDSVDYVVSHSYKTVILLSRAAVRDRWFMLKLRIAMDHVSDTRTEFVVTVFLEDIPDDEIPFLARLYLKDGRPYLHWPENVRGHEFFWHELVKYLTINLKTNDLIPNE